MQFLKWKAYFQANTTHFDHINWDLLQNLSPTEKQLITASIRQFQRGEHSEGKHFLQFAKSMSDESYIDAVKIFIREEQDHALVLGQYMDGVGISRIKNDGLDNIFRRLRKMAGLEGTITVLLTAEIISMIYYQSLQKATSSAVLQEICKQILVDEKMHLRFQSYALRLLYRRKNRLSLLMSQSIHTVLMLGTIGMVWLFHRRVLLAGGYSCYTFSRDVWKMFRHCQQMIAGKAAVHPRLTTINHAA